MKAVSGKELGRILERKGWVLQRTAGSHRIDAHPDNPGTILTVRVHRNKPLERGTQHALMGAAGLTEKDLT